MSPSARLPIALAAAVVGMAACGPAQSPSGPPLTPAMERYEGERAYVATAFDVFGGAVEEDVAGPQLLSCYESNVGYAEFGLTTVELRLVLTREGARVRAVNQETSLGPAFATCVEQVVRQWDLQTTPMDEVLVPIEFGPLFERN